MWAERNRRFHRGKASILNSEGAVEQQLSTDWRALSDFTRSSSVCSAAAAAAAPWRAPLLRVQTLACWSVCGLRTLTSEQQQSDASASQSEMCSYYPGADAFALRVNQLCVFTLWQHARELPSLCWTLATCTGVNNSLSHPWVGLITAQWKAQLTYFPHPIFPKSLCGQVYFGAGGYCYPSARVWFSGHQRNSTWKQEAYKNYPWCHAAEMKEGIVCRHLSMLEIKQPTI